MLIELLLGVTGFSALAATVLNVLGTSLYDVQSIKRQRRQQVHPNAKHYKNRPLVSVIVYAHNDAHNIEACLRSVLRSRYRKLQVTVADNASDDATKRLVRAIIAEYPKRSIKLYAKRKTSQRAAVMAGALKAQSVGQLVLVLDADVMASDLAIKAAVQRFNHQPSLDILTFNFRRQPAQKTSALLQDFGLMLRNRASKANSYFNADYFADFQPASFYNRQALVEILKSRPLSPLLQFGDKMVIQAHASEALIYVPALRIKQLANDLVSLKGRQIRAIARASRLLINKQNPNHSLKSVWLLYPLSILFAVASLIFPIALAYFTYLALILRQPAFLFVCLSALTLLLAFTVLEDEHSGLLRKLKYIGLIPITYGWYYLMVFAQYLVAALPVLKLVRLSRNRHFLDA